jgi:hypothetical protein
MSFTFGPVQTKFVEALESGLYEQCFEEIRNGNATCAIGLADKVCNLGEIESHVFLYDNYPKLGLFSSTGKCQVPAGKPIIRIEDSSVSDLFYTNPGIASLNDEFRFTFKEIAEHLRKYPDYYFAYPI